MPYTYEEIHKLLDKADERERMIVLLLASSGVRRGALPELKYGDLKWIEQYQIYEITVYKGFKEEYVTYCSSECAYYINSYLDFRRRNGEQLTPDSYLIRKQFDTTNHRWTIKVSNATDPPQKHKTTMRNLESIIYHLIYDSGIRDYGEKKARLGDRHKNMAAHSFRKFFENKCLEAGIDPFYVSVLMGHKAGIGVERHYYRPTTINGENSLLELYVKKAMPYLTISDESRLKLKNRELEMRIQEQNEMNKRIEDLKKEFEVREDLLRKVMDERIARALDAREKAKEK
jgi:integrase